MTINIYDSSGDYKRLEFCRNGENAKNEMPIRIELKNKKEEWFNISKEDAKELIKYLRKEFNISLGEI